MPYLLDTHTLIWMVEGSDSLSVKAKSILDDPDKTKYVSVVNLWEIAIKISNGKLRVRKDIHTLPNLLRSSGFIFLTITELHALAVDGLAFHHKDPFDRLLIVQAQLEKLTIITKDPNILLYNVATVW